LASSTPQLEIFEVMIDKANEHENVIRQIRELDLEQTTPIDAWHKLLELQKNILGES
jgi:hypothetical protein